MKRFIDIHVPVTACNLECHYCYVTQSNGRNSKATQMRYSPEVIGKALTKERLGGICHFNMCGLGETLIPNQIVEITKRILAEGHYIMIVTNGTLTKRFQQFAELPIEYRRRLGFKFSYHYLEFKRKNLLKTFYDNVELVKNTGMSYSIEMTPSDELEPYIDEIKSECMEHFGAPCHVTIPRDVTKPGYKLQSKHTIEEFAEIWGTFESDMLRFKLSTWEQPRKEYCYAGAWSGLLNIGNGDFCCCYGSRVHQNIFEDITRPIEFIAVGHDCRIEHCYNGHSFLALGTIPEINTCNYAMERDRVNVNDGTHWLNDEMRAFLSERLEDENRIFTKHEKRANCIKKYKYEAIYLCRKVWRKLIEK